MCGRFALDTDRADIERRFRAAAQFTGNNRHFNVAPGMTMPIVIKKSPAAAVLARWGLVPFWAKDPKIGYRMINARREGIEAKPAFRKPLRTQRCLVPTTGFFEWKHIGKEKIPYFIRLKGGGLFAFAGLYDEWKDAESRPLLTFTIITTEPNGVVEPIHNRMPVVFSREEEDMWLDSGEQDVQKLLALLDPHPDDRMEAYPVSKLVNNPVNDGPEVVKRDEELSSLVS